MKYALIHSLRTRKPKIKQWWSSSLGNKLSPFGQVPHQHMNTEIVRAEQVFVSPQESSRQSTKVTTKIKLTTMPLIGQLKCFLNSWKMLTRDQDILSVVEGYKIPFPTEPHQKKLSNKGNCLSASKRSEERFSEKFIPSWETRWGLSHSNQPI